MEFENSTVVIRHRCYKYGHFRPPIKVSELMLTSLQAVVLLKKSKITVWEKPIKRAKWYPEDHLSNGKEFTNQGSGGHTTSARLDSCQEIFTVFVCRIYSRVFVSECE